MDGRAPGADIVDWEYWERLLRERGVVIDRPRGSAHPRYPGMIYPLDYGYIPGTAGGDGAEVDVFVGTVNTGLRAVLLTADARKGDRELKLLWNLSDAEIAAARRFLTSDGMRVEARWRVAPRKSHENEDEMMPADAKFERFLAAADQPFSGWDFSWVTDTGRMSSGVLPWNYASVVLPYLWGAQAMADLGTGGDEFLSCLRPLPPQTFATEGYAPNVSVARARLEPLGVRVYEIDETDTLPFADTSLDLIINRHESYRPEEVFRALRPGGCFITQQVGGANEKQVSDWLGAPFEVGWADWSLDVAARGLDSAGFTILKRREAVAPTRFYDIGALVYYLKAIPWQIPDFSVARYHDALLRLHARIQADGYLESQSARFLLVAHRPE